MEKRAVFRNLIVVVVVVAIVPPVLWGAPRIVDGQHGGDPWRNTLFDFQTLIAGFFAVAAALWTVRQMQETDRLAALRHLEQMELQTRPDKLKLERNIVPLMPLLYGGASVLQAVERGLLREPASLRDRFLAAQSSTMTVMQTVGPTADEIRACLEEITPLLDQKMHGLMQNALHHANALMGLTNAIHHRPANDLTPFGLGEIAFGMEITSYPIACISTSRAFEELAMAFRALAKLYSFDAGM